MVHKAVPSVLILSTVLFIIVLAVVKVSFTLLTVVDEAAQGNNVEEDVGLATLLVRHIAIKSENQKSY